MLAFALAVGPALACSCGSTLADDAEAATVVVEATVLDVHPERRQGVAWPMHLRVEGVYKGNVTVGQELAAYYLTPCMELHPGSHPILFLRGAPDALVAGFCYGFAPGSAVGRALVKDAFDSIRPRMEALAALRARALTAEDTLEALAWGAALARDGGGPVPDTVFGVPVGPVVWQGWRLRERLSSTPHAALIAIGEMMAPRLVAAESSPSKRPFDWLPREEREALPTEFQSLDRLVPGAGARAYDALLAVPPGQPAEATLRAVCGAVMGTTDACADTPWGAAPRWGHDAPERQ